MTECPIISMNSVDDADEKLARTEGRATRGGQIKVVKLAGGPAGACEEGELRVKGPQLCCGYLDASLNEDAFDGDGYFKSGDLGYLDEDGYVVITGRSKDIIIRKGENISAKEVEDLLYQHPKVTDTAVIGLPDPASGERCCAVVACIPSEEPLGFAEMTAFLKESGLMIQKIPEQLEIVSEIPRNPTGKILKEALRKKFGA